MATAVNATKAAGVDNAAQVELLKSADRDADASSRRRPARWTRPLGHHADGEPLRHAKYFRDTVLPAMAALRTLGDKLETMVADDLWPLPTYREMLFIR